MKVKATKNGYYDNKRRKEGAVFELAHPDKEFSHKWMEQVGPAKKKKAVEVEEESQDEEL
jgi:hypothetical protein